jgi:drug/metabolite transporter (DMT)-like permease
MKNIDWVLIFVGVIMSSLGAIFLKLGAIRINYDGDLVNILKQLTLNWRIFIGCLMYLMPVLIWIFLLKKIELSFLQPIFSLVYIVTPFFAFFLLNETLNFYRLIGIIMIVIGIFVSCFN